MHSTRTYLLPWPDIAAFWPTQPATNRGGKGSTQAMLTQVMDEDDEDMPLLPRSRRRILDDDDLNNDITPMPPPPSSLATRGRAGRSAISETPAPSQPKKVATASRSRTTTQRQLRESSVVSDASSAGGRGTRATRLPASSTQARKGKATPTVIEESEDEVNRDLGPARSSTGTGSRAMGRHTSGAAGSASGRAGDDEVTTASSRGKTQSSLGATGRRRLLVADDDDDGELVSRKVYNGRHSN